jgi:hypothetical protein
MVMSNRSEPKIDPEPPVNYQIRIAGHLTGQWTDWFDGLTISLEETGVTCLTGPVADQAALYGLLKKVRDLGMPLVSVNRTERSHPIASGTSSSQINGTHPNALKRSKQ